jgi:predicted RNase H-like HicB family nuclease
MPAEVATAHYPVMMALRDSVSGNGFLAGVTLSGRALFVREDDGKWWVYGVRPGAIAASGNTPAEAFQNFRNAYKNALFDFASDAPTFDMFRHQVEQFYQQPDKEEEENWLGAFYALRSGKVVPDEKFFSQLPKEDPEKRPTQIAVERLDRLDARYASVDNVPDYVAVPELAKAA